MHKKFYFNNNQSQIKRIRKNLKQPMDESGMYWYSFSDGTDGSPGISGNPRICTGGKCSGRKKCYL